MTWVPHRRCLLWRHVHYSLIIASLPQSRGWWVYTLLESSLLQDRAWVQLLQQSTNDIACVLSSAMLTGSSTKL